MAKEAVLGIVISVCVAMIVFAIAWYRYEQKRNRETQREISDRDLLRLLNDQPDKLLSPHQLRDLTGLSLGKARGRLSSLFMYGILNRSSNSRGRHFYGFKHPLEEEPDLPLSSDPFLTVEDLLQIFEVHDQRVSAQELIMATGLPLAVIKREMKYFEKQGIVQKLQRADAMGTMTSRFFVLQEPYRSNPNLFREKASVLNLEMRELLRNDNLLV
ncbi:MAG: hypothetical protein AAGF89_00645 [Bacteroidota bacterium]